MAAEFKWVLRSRYPTLVVFYRRMPRRDREPIARKKWGTQEDSSQSIAFSSVPKMKEQTGVKSSNSLDTESCEGVGECPCLAEDKM